MIMMKNDKETWKPIKGFGNYSISNHGRVFSKRKNIVLKGSIRHGYKSVTLYNNGRIKGFLVSRLVLMAFIPNPMNKPECSHKDGNKLNNSLDNLEWVTSRENVHHAIKAGRYKDKRKCHKNKTDAMNYNRYNKKNKGRWANYQYTSILKRDEYVPNMMLTNTVPIEEVCEEYSALY